jgi:hypothetical protein
LPKDVKRGPDGSIESIDLTRFAEQAAQATDPLDLIISVNRAPGGESDGVTRVGFINAEGLDLGNVAIKGSLGRIVVGDNLANRAALGSLNVARLGTTEAIVEPLVTEIHGAAGTINIRRDMNHAAIVANGRVSTLHIGGNLLGTGSPTISAPALGVLTLDGSMNDAKVRTNNITSFAAGGDMQDSTVTTRKIGMVTVGGDFINGALIAKGEIKTLEIFGKLMSTDPEDPVVIIAKGRPPGADLARTAAIGTLFVHGGVENALILVGYNQAREAVNPDAMVDEVIVKGSWTASSLVVGVLDATGDGFGRNDTSIDASPKTMIHSRIARIVIQGPATGSRADGDFFGITAETIGFAKINYTLQPLSDTFRDDLLLDPGNNDFRLVELVGAKPGV